MKKNKRFPFPNNLKIKHNLLEVYSNSRPVSPKQLISTDQLTENCAFAEFVVELIILLISITDHAPADQSFLASKDSLGTVNRETLNVKQSKSDTRV